MDGNPGDGRDLSDRILSPGEGGDPEQDRHSTRRWGDPISRLRRAARRNNPFRGISGRGRGGPSSQFHQPDITHIQQPLRRAGEIAPSTCRDESMLEATNDQDDASTDEGMRDLTAPTGQPSSEECLARAGTGDDWVPPHHSSLQASHGQSTSTGLVQSVPVEQLFGPRFSIHGGFASTLGQYDVPGPSDEISSSSWSTHQVLGIQQSNTWDRPPGTQQTLHWPRPDDRGWMPQGLSHPPSEAGRSSSYQGEPHTGDHHMTPYQVFGFQQPNTNPPGIQQTHHWPPSGDIGWMPQGLLHPIGEAGTSSSYQGEPQTGDHRIAPYPVSGIQQPNTSPAGIQQIHHWPPPGDTRLTPQSLSHPMREAGSESSYLEQPKTGDQHMTPYQVLQPNMFPSHQPNSWPDLSSIGGMPQGLPHPARGTGGSSSHQGEPQTSDQYIADVEQMSRTETGTPLGSHTGRNRRNVVSRVHHVVRRHAPWRLFSRRGMAQPDGSVTSNPGLQTPHGRSTAFVPSVPSQQPFHPSSSAQGELASSIGQYDVPGRSDQISSSLGSCSLIPAYSRPQREIGASAQAVGSASTVGHQAVSVGGGIPNQTVPPHVSNSDMAHEAASPYQALEIQQQLNTSPSDRQLTHHCPDSGRIGLKSQGLPHPTIESGGSSSYQGEPKIGDQHMVEPQAKLDRPLTEREKKKIYMIDALKARYKKDYDRVQPIPYIKDRLYCVDKVYVEGGFEFRNTASVARAGDSWERLESYKIAFSDQRMQSIRRVFEGEPGFGKTTFTLQLAYDWCNRVEGSPMQDVDILILLRLRQLGGVRSIYRAIDVCLLKDEVRVIEADIGNIIRESGSVVVILDGYDEYPDQHSRNQNDVQRILRLDLFENIHVILTTRYLPDYFAPVTKRIRLTGFDELARDEYIRKAVVGEYDPEGLQFIRARLKANPVLEDLCQVPLVFVMFAHIANEKSNFQNFRSVTDFFRYMITCFHEHLRNKSYESNVKRYNIREVDHAALDQLAFSALNKPKQKITWSKEEMCKNLGEKSYNAYFAMGILVEEEVVSDKPSREVDVRFYHKLFCEWYAAHYIAFILSQPGQSVTPGVLFRHMNPEDLQYVYRFACGINPDVGKSIIQYLTETQRRADRFAVLCMLERSGDVEDILGTVQDMCSQTVTIEKGDNRLLQRSTVQLLDIATGHNIPVSCLYLDECLSKFDVTNVCIVLKSDFRLTNLRVVKVLRIEETKTKIEFTREELMGLLQTCEGLEEIRFEGEGIHLPLSIPPEMISPALKNRNIRVHYDCGLGYLFGFDDGRWKVDEQATDQSLKVTIGWKDIQLAQEWCIQQLEMAAEAGIPVSHLQLDDCFSKFDVTESCIVLLSELRLTNLKTVKKLHVEEGDDRLYNSGHVEVTREELLGLLQTCEALEEIRFEGNGCHLPLSVPAELIPYTLKTRNIKVSYDRGHGMVHQLNWDDGQWQHRITADGSVKEVRIFPEALDQQWGMNELAVLSAAGVSISVLYLSESFSNISDDTQSMILTSGCTIPVLHTLRKFEIWYTDVDLEVFLKILAYANECTEITELEFYKCKVPDEVDPQMIPPLLKRRRVKVHKFPGGYLSYETGCWKRR